MKLGIKARRKACAHCLFSKKHLGSEENITELRARALSGNSYFRCHEHSEKVCCAGYYSRMKAEPIFDSKVEVINENGDLRPKFSNMKREEINKQMVYT